MLRRIRELSGSDRRRVRLLASLAIAAGVLVAAWHLLLVVVPLAVSIIVAALLMPVMRLGERLPTARRWPGGNRVAVAALATLLAVVASLTLIGAGAYGLAGGVNTFARMAPVITEEGNAAFAEIEASYRSAVPEALQEEFDPRLESIREGVLDAGAEALEKTARIITSNIGQMIALLGTPVAVFQFLFRPRALPEAVGLLIPGPLREDLSAMGRLTGELIIAYVRVQLIGALFVGVVVWLLYWAVGIQLAPSLGMLAAAAELIPVVGSTIFLLLAAIAVGLTDPALLPVALAFYLLVQFLQNSIVTPRLQGMALGVNPVVLVMALAIFGLFFGILGALVAAPVTAAALRVLRYVRDEWAAA